MPSAPKVPKPPDPVVTAAAQTKSNLDTLRGTQTARNVSQETNYGNLDYQITGTDAQGVPIYKAVSKLSPDQQALLDQLENSQIGLGGAGGNLVADSAGMYSEAPDFSEAAGTQTNTNMSRFAQYMDPSFTQQTEQLDNQLRNQGLNPGTQAYDRALRTLRQDQGLVRSRALNEYQPLAFQQAQQQYNQPLQTLASIFGLTQPAGLSNQFVKTPGADMAGTDVAGITKSAYDQSLEAYKGRLAQHNSLISGGTQMLTALMGLG